MNCGPGEGGSKNRSGRWGQRWEQHIEPAQKGSAGFWGPLKNHRSTGAQDDLGWKGAPLSLDQVAQSIIEPDFNTCNDTASTASLFQCLTILIVPGVPVTRVVTCPGGPARTLL